jgi:hypothetical protein
VILWIKRTRHDSLDKEDKKKEKEEDQAERARLGSDYDSVVWLIGYDFSEGILLFSGWFFLIRLIL